MYESNSNDSTYSWFHDDITWCVDECSHTECERHLTNRLMKDGQYSGAMYRNTPTCPYYNEHKTDQSTPA